MLNKEALEGKEERDLSLPTLFKRMGLLAPDHWRTYLIGGFFACSTYIGTHINSSLNYQPLGSSVSGLVFPSFSILYSKGIEGFSLPDDAGKRHAGDRNALWFFIMSILASLAIGSQNYFLGAAAAALITRLRSLSFKAILRQDISFFDKDENSVRTLCYRILTVSIDLGFDRLVLSPQI